MATLIATSPTFIERLCQTPAILWNVWDYCIPPITRPKNDRLQAARILLYIFGKPTLQLNGMWERGIDSYLQSHLPTFYQRQLEQSVLNCLTFYASYVGKFSKLTGRWYQETDNNLSYDWNDRRWISQKETKVVLRWSSIIDQGLIELVQGCPNIQNINLYDTTITDKGLIALAQWCPNLKKIRLNSSQKITDNGLITLAQGCPNIIYIDLSGTNITDQGLIVLTQGCSNIQKINLSGTRITDKGLTALAQGCSNIQKINLSWTKITDQGLTTLLQKCPNIQQIILTGCIAVTETGRNYLADWYPDIRTY